MRFAMNLLDLPDVLLIEIFEYLSYEEVSKKRLICRRLDQVAQSVLNCGFNKIVRKHAVSFKRIKALLPRRESERRNHCLARHADILTSLETRISMLSMTYSKYIDLHLCCFIPGRVLDEMHHILQIISKTAKPLRPHEVLQELRDISSMAIEHFDEKIANTLKKSIMLITSSSVSGDAGHGGLGVSGVGVIQHHHYGAGNNTNMSGNVVSAAVNANLTDSTLNNLLIHNHHHHRCNAVATTTFKCNNHHYQQQQQQQCKCWCRNELPPISAQETTATRATPAVFSSTKARHTACKLKRLELKHKILNIKMQRVQYTQTKQTLRLQHALNAISEQNIQIIDLKKRLEDLDAKNREISANFKQQHICTDDTTATKTTLKSDHNDTFPTTTNNTPPTTTSTIASTMDINTTVTDTSTHIANATLTPSSILTSTQSMPVQEIKSYSSSVNVKTTDSSKRVQRSNLSISSTAIDTSSVARKKRRV